MSSAAASVAAAQPTSELDYVINRQAEFVAAHDPSVKAAREALLKAEAAAKESARVAVVMSTSRRLIDRYSDELSTLNLKMMEAIIRVDDAKKLRAMAANHVDHRPTYIQMVECVIRHKAMNCFEFLVSADKYNKYPTPNVTHLHTFPVELLTNEAYFGTSFTYFFRRFRSLYPHDAVYALRTLVDTKIPVNRHPEFIMRVCAFYRKYLKMRAEEPYHLQASAGAFHRFAKAIFREPKFGAAVHQAVYKALPLSCLEQNIKSSTTSSGHLYNSCSGTHPTSVNCIRSNRCKALARTRLYMASMLIGKWSGTPKATLKNTSKKRKTMSSSSSAAAAASNAVAALPTSLSRSLPDELTLHILSFLSNAFTVKDSYTLIKQRAADVTRPAYRGTVAASASLAAAAAVTTEVVTIDSDEEEEEKEDEGQARLRELRAPDSAAAASEVDISYVGHYQMRMKHRRATSPAAAARAANAANAAANALFPPNTLFLPPPDDTNLTTDTDSDSDLNSEDAAFLVEGDESDAEME